MNEGWHNDEYLVLYSEAEGTVAAARYDLNSHLPGHTLIGLRGWDDFIVINSAGSILSVPTVPLNSTSAQPFSLPDKITLEPDTRYAGKIKWYLKPIAFGGNPQDECNLTWVSHEQHAELVVWWNGQYKRLTEHSTNA